jgi:hypothetical protein
MQLTFQFEFDIKFYETVRLFFPANARLSLNVKLQVVITYLAQALMVCIKEESFYRHTYYLIFIT